MVQSKEDCITSQTHSGSPECHCRQAVPTQAGDSDGMVTLSGDFRPSLPEVVPTESGPVCNQIQSQTPQVCVYGSGQLSLEGRGVEPQPFNKQGALMKWQHELKLLRRSTRAVYESKWAILSDGVRKDNKVDFRSPSIKQIADFLLFLFREKHLQPSTIDGYTTAIADKVGNDKINISQDENLTRLLDSFHRDKPKGRQGIPSWNLSLALHQLTKPPFKPLRKASLKHLTFKTVFLSALGSGKRRSEIHAWVHKNIRHQDWSKVSLYPSPGFICKNQLAKEGPGCVAPVIIPALAPTLDKSLKEDRTLFSEGFALLFRQDQGAPDR